MSACENGVKSVGTPMSLVEWVGVGADFCLILLCDCENLCPCAMSQVRVQSLFKSEELLVGLFCHEVASRRGVL